MKSSFLATCLFFIALMMSAPAQAIVNGGFETGDFTGWNTTSAFGNVAVVSSYTFGDGTVVDPYEGDYMAMLGSPDGPHDNWNITNQIMQVPINKQPISFYYNFWSYDQGDNDSPAFQILVNGTSIASFTPGSVFGQTGPGLKITGWQLFTIDAALLSGLAGSTISLAFMAGDTSDLTAPSGVFIDAVTPIPSAVWLFGTGLVGLVGLRRRFTP